MGRKVLSRQVWLPKLLFPREDLSAGLALCWLPGGEFWALRIFCLIRVFLHAWGLGPCVTSLIRYFMLTEWFFVCVDASSDLSEAAWISSLLLNSCWEENWLKRKQSIQGGGFIFTRPESSHSEWKVIYHKSDELIYSWSEQNQFSITMFSSFVVKPLHFTGLIVKYLYFSTSLAFP